MDYSWWFKFVPQMSAMLSWLGLYCFTIIVYHQIRRYFDRTSSNMASRKMLLAINGLFSSAVRSVLPKSSVSAISPAACVSFGGTSRSLYLIKLKDCLVCISRQTNQPAMPSNSYKFLRSWRVPFGLASRRFTSRQFGYVNGVGSRVVRLNSMLSQLSGKVNDVIMVYLRQCHVIAALRIRRATQIIAWYSDLGYDLQTLRRLINQLATSVGRHFRSGKKEKSVFAIFSGVAAFNWDENKIQEEQLKELVSFLRMDGVFDKIIVSVVESVLFKIWSGSVAEHWNRIHWH